MTSGVTRLAVLLTNAFYTDSQIDFVTDAAHHKVHAKVAAFNGKRGLKSPAKTTPGIFSGTGGIYFYSNWARLSEEG